MSCRESQGGSRTANRKLSRAGCSRNLATSKPKTQQRSSVYRGATREVAEAAYHADARVMVRMGYAPASEDWSTVLEQVLMVHYVHAPERASAVLDALSEAEAERAVPGPLPAPVLRTGLERAAGRYEVQTLEVKLTVGAITGIAAGVALWTFLAGSIFGDNLILLFVSMFGLGFAGLLIGAMVTLSHHSRAR